MVYSHKRRATTCQRSIRRASMDPSNLSDAYQWTNTCVRVTRRVAVTVNLIIILLSYYLVNVALIAETEENVVDLNVFAAFFPTLPEEHKRKFGLANPINNTE
ncbi:hypothetical protein NPIL_413091 [Nephila pilipes]|uniref:Uncharacterized protein n=1 Tax=Nephila pilipes TaxID=299642 RepID=A0A8X6NKQ4_NEPPI|nr:hypothetical protein NPIL_413091 [Nephila pilipes]